MRKQFFGLALVASGMFAGVASAAPITIGNYSFESSLDYGTVNGVGNFTTDGSYDIFAFGAPFATQGSSAAYTNAAETSLYQRLGAIQEGTYTFTADFGSRAGGSPTAYLVAYGFDGGYYNVGPGGSAAAVTATPLDGTVLKDQTFSFAIAAGDANIGRTLHIQFVGGGQQSTFDNVRGDFVAAAAVPEPASLAVLGLGGMAALRRRRTA
jgi:hypothetical protein